MLKRLCFLLSLVLGIALLSGCSSALEASLDSEFTLSVGQSAHVTSESIDIRFIGVTADSRCAKGVECIWAGEVSCEIEITKDGIKNRVTLKTVQPWDSSWGNTFQNYWLLFDVSPYPEAGKTIAKSDYRLSLTVKKLPN